MRLPPGSWDSHVHVFGPAETYPPSRDGALYDPPAHCGVGDLEALHEALGFQHAVLVQPTIYGSDHTLLLNVLSGAPSGRYVGVAIVSDVISDVDLEAMHKAGVRGARFNFGRKFRLAPTHDEFRRQISRIQELGWFVKVFGYGDDFLAFADELSAIESPAVIDHLGGPSVEHGVGADGFRFVLELLKRPNWWGMLSNGDTRSSQGFPWPDVTPFGRLFYEIAPDRCLWGSDWPHVHRFIRADGHDADYGFDHERKRIELLRGYLPDDLAFRRVLVDNPSRFFEAVR